MAMNNFGNIEYTESAYNSSSNTLWSKSKLKWHHKSKKSLDTKRIHIEYKWVSLLRATFQNSQTKHRETLKGIITILSDFHYSALKNRISVLFLKNPCLIGSNVRSNWRGRWLANKLKYSEWITCKYHKYLQLVRLPPSFFLIV